MSRIFKYFIAFVFVVSYLQNNCFGQDPFYVKYTTLQGIPGSEIYDIIQDKKGLIWIATNGGVASFDGNDFAAFDNNKGLPDNTVFDLLEDSLGRIWTVPFSKRIAYIENNKIKKYKYNSVIESFHSESFLPLHNSMRVNSAGGVSFAICTKGLLEISESGKLVNHSNLNPGINIVYDENGGVYFYSNHDSKLLFVNKKGVSTQVENAPLLNPFDLQRVALNRSTNHMFFSSGNVLVEIAGNRVVNTRTFTNRIISLYCDNSGHLWVGLYKGGVCLFTGGDISREGRIFFDAKSVSAVTFSADGSLWVCTLDDGLFLLPNFKVLNYSSFGIGVNAFCTFNNKVVAGLNSNSLIFSSKSGISFHEVTPNNSFVINSLLVNNNLLWVAGNKGVYSFHEQNGKLVQAKQMGFPALSVCPINADSIYAGSYYGLMVINNKTGEFKTVFPKFNKRIHSIVRDSKGIVWLGTMDGLYKIENNNIVPCSGNTLLSQRINGMCEAGSNGLFLATNGSGIVYYNKGICTQISTQQGLASNIVRSILVAQGKVWVGTNQGLNVFDFDTSYSNVKIYSIGAEKGLSCADVKSVFARGDSVYVGTSCGMSVFHTADVVPSQYKPGVIIKSIKIENRDTILLPSYNLSYDKNFITVNFAGIYFKSMGKTVYKYFLQGTGSGWIYTRQNQLQLPSLSPGNYILKIVALNEDGVEGSLPAIIEFKINPPFWRTWWFFGSIILLIIAITSFIFFIRIRELGKRNFLKQEMNRYAQQALSAQMNPHFIFNSLNSIQNFILQNDAKASNKFLSKFSLLMRTVLNNSQHASIPLFDELEALTLYIELEELRFRGKFTFHIETTSDLALHQILIPTLLIQPYVENSIWHGFMNLEGQGFLQIKISKYSPTHLMCVVEDNGIGREKAQEFKKNKISTHKSVGTKITEKRLELIGSLHHKTATVVYTDLFTPENKPCGTRVEIKIPIL